MSIYIMVLGLLSIALYFIILALVPKISAGGDIKVFADFTDAGVTLVINLMTIPFYTYALYIGIERFIWGYSFLMLLLVLYNFRLAYKYNRGKSLAVLTSLISRLVIPAVDALFFGMNMVIMIIYTQNMGLSLKFLWGFCLFSIVCFITVVSLHNLVVKRKFSSLIMFVGNFCRQP